jgi:hypothetical protein
MTNDTILTLDAMPQRAPGLEVRSAGSEQLVQSSATGHVHVLNALAGLVLQRCDGATPLERIVDDIVATTEVDRARAERDVLSVCADFRAKALIV